MSLLSRLLGKRSPARADVVVSAVAPLVGGEALGLLVSLIPRNFGLRDLGGGQAIGNSARTRDLLTASLHAHEPITPYYLIDLFRGQGLVANEPSGLALFDAALAGSLSAAAQGCSGKPPSVVLIGWEEGTISQDRLRFSYQQIAQNAAAISDRWSD
jgi:hypothetical protein